MKSYSEFKNLIENKSILYIPIISCINRDTQEYNLAADGNVNRFITTFSLCDTYKNLIIVLPEKHIDKSDNIVKEFQKHSNKNILLFYSKNFGIHAGEQRNKDEIVDALYEELKDIETDIIIFESQKLGLKFLNSNNIAIKIFWNPVSRTKEKTRIFLEGYEKINQEIIERSDNMIIASPEQIDYYNEYSDKLIYLDKLIDRDLPIFDYQKDIKFTERLINEAVFRKEIIYYLPFRLSDEGYKLDKVLNYILSKDEKFVVFYTDPNNCHILDKFKSNNIDIFYNKFYKVDSNRDSYYTFIDNENVIIPYFEDIEFINHAAIHEFMSKKSKCKVILYRQYNNPYNINKCERIKIID